jgi:hypothetical protein
MLQADPEGQMKRSETILVYGVTAMLLVILVVALFTNQDPQTTPANEADRGARASNFTEIVGLDEKLGVHEPANPPNVDAADTNPGGADPKRAGDGFPVDRPLDARASKPSIGEVFGPYVRQMDTRIVVVRANDTLSGLVEKWCGSVDALPRVLSLNETLTETSRLEIGRSIALPWIDDEELLAQYEQRKLGSVDLTPANDVRHAAEPRGPVASPAVGTTPRPATAPATASGLQDMLFRPNTGSPAATPAGTATPAPASRAEPKPLVTTPSQHVVVAGDSLWKIAVAKVGVRDAGRYIEMIKAANPGLDPDHLKLKSTLKLP